MYLDRFVVQLLERLDETGLYDRSLVIVTADHGISFRPGGWKRHADATNVAESPPFRSSSSTRARGAAAWIHGRR